MLGQPKLYIYERSEFIIDKATVYHLDKDALNRVFSLVGYFEKKTTFT
jgi:hypothetical protein